MRRSFLVLFALAASMLAVPATSLAASADFTHGVASGDVTQSSAVLWTRAIPIGPAVNVTVDVWEEADCLSGQKVYKSKVKSVSRLARLHDQDRRCRARPRHRVLLSVPSRRRRRSARSATSRRHRQRIPLRTSTSPTTVTRTAPAAPRDRSTARSPRWPRRKAPTATSTLPTATTSTATHITGPGPAMTLAEYRAAYKEALDVPEPDLTSCVQGFGQYALMDDHEVQNDYDGQTVRPGPLRSRASGVPRVPRRSARPACSTTPPARVTRSTGRSSGAGRRGVQFSTRVPAAAPTFRRSAAATWDRHCRRRSGRRSRSACSWHRPYRRPARRRSTTRPDSARAGPEGRVQERPSGSTAKLKLIQNEYAIQQFHALPYDRWEGYAAERNEIIDFIGDNNLHDVVNSNVVFMTTDHHATIQNEVFKDRFTRSRPREVRSS